MLKGYTVYNTHTQAHARARARSRTHATNSYGQSDTSVVKTEGAKQEREETLYGRLCHSQSGEIYSCVARDIDRQHARAISIGVARYFLQSTTEGTNIKRTTRIATDTDIVE